MEENTVDVSASLVASFIVDDRIYGITTAKVREVVRVGEITPVHHSPEFIIGIMNLRGKIITVVDLGRKLGLKRQELTSHSRIFIAEWRQEHVGLLVDRVGEVVTYDKNNLRSVPENLPATQAAMLEGVFHADSMLIGLLDIEAILDENKSLDESINNKEVVD